jgi:hypothetical protein
MRARGRGTLVLTSSLAGLTAVPADPMYAATKHAVVGLARALGPALAADHIAVNALCPGFADTTINEPVRHLISAAGIPLMTADELADALLAILASDQTGEARRRPGSGGSSPPHPVPQAEQLTLNPAVAPARILPGQLLHKVTDILCDRRSSRRVRVRPFPLGQTPERAHHCPVSPVRPRPRDLTAQDRHLMPKHQNPRILGGIGPRQEHQPPEDPDHEQVDKADQHERRH